MNAISLDPPWLEFDLGEDMQVLSWALNRPGFVQANRILWREVRNADLPIGLDVDAWLSSELESRNASEAVTFLTSRPLRHYTQSVKTTEIATAHAIATVGFSNAERVGHRVDRSRETWGTINVAVRLNMGLTQAALLEAMSITVQARTAAVMDVGYRISSGLATGTGTDCVAVAAPLGKERYAGLHTAVGEAAGGAVYDAVLEGAVTWVDSMKESEHAAN